MTLSDSQVKAVFLYNLAQFTDWPADRFSSPQAPLVLCVVGDDRILFEFERMIAGRSINGRELRFRKYSRGQDARDCQILFFGAAGRKELPALLQNVRGASVLTVSDADDFTETGGAVRVLIVEQHVRFEINQEAVTQAHLKISSKLLSLTRISLADRRPGGN